VGVTFNRMRSYRDIYNEWLNWLKADAIVRGYRVNIGPFGSLRINSAFDRKDEVIAYLASAVEKLKESLREISMEPAEEDLPELWDRNPLSENDVHQVHLRRAAWKGPGCIEYHAPDDRVYARRWIDEIEETPIYPLLREKGDRAPLPGDKVAVRVS